MNLAGESGDKMAYLIPKGQQVVVEEDGGGRNSIILVATRVMIPHNES